MPDSTKRKFVQEHQPQHPTESASRGVYRLPWAGPNDETYLAVVNRFGRSVYHATVYDAAYVRAAEIALWDMLEAVDPSPVLRVMSS